MNDDDGGGTLDPEMAAELAGWFKVLGDPTRVSILNLLSVAGRPLAVAEITAATDVGQSTVSHHLAKLAAVRFVLVERIGTSSLWRVNERCLSRFPLAAEIVMGRAAATTLHDPEDSCDRP